MIVAENLRAGPGVAHAFFTRAGGVSEGRYASLNCGLGSGDEPARVHENRARAMRRLDRDGHHLATAFQVHSADVAVIEKPWPHDSRPRLDALVSDTPGVALGILTADCAPVLFADATARVIGAAHAGWRGAKGGVLEATVKAMVARGARVERIQAAIGPCIRQASYEVGPDFRAAFVADTPAADRFFAPAARSGHFRFDLAGFVARRLAAIGVGDIEITPHDTFADEGSFFSYRRVTLNGGGDYGRLLSAIVLES